MRPDDAPAAAGRQGPEGRQPARAGGRAAGLPEALARLVGPGHRVRPSRSGTAPRRAGSRGWPRSRRRSRTRTAPLPTSRRPTAVPDAAARRRSRSGPVSVHSVRTCQQLNVEPVQRALRRAARSRARAPNAGPSPSGSSTSIWMRRPSRTRVIAPQQEERVEAVHRRAARDVHQAERVARARLPASDRATRPAASPCPQGAGGRPSPAARRRCGDRWGAHRRRRGCRGPASGGRC